MTNNSKKIYYMVITALFTALSFAGTHIKINLPTGDFIHLGNFVCILSSFLFGPTIGAITGGLGMGLADISMGFMPSIIIRTFIVKSLMGAMTGFLFSWLVKKEKNIKLLMIIQGSFFILLGIIFTIPYFLENNGFNISIDGLEKFIPINAVLPILLFISGISLFLIAVIFKGLKYLDKVVLYTASVAIFINISLEFIVKVFLPYFLERIPITTNLVSAISKIPGSIVTGFITITLVVLVYEPVIKALNKEKV